MSSSEKIIRTYPELTVFQVEYEGNLFDCNRCMGKGKCCGAENSEFNNPKVLNYYIYNYRVKLFNMIK